jgi:hypothetical protein
MIGAPIGYAIGGIVSSGLPGIVVQPAPAGRPYPMPLGPLFDARGWPSIPGKAYLAEIQMRTERINAIEPLDGGTTYTFNQLRDKIIELIQALQG